MRKLTIGLVLAGVFAAGAIIGLSATPAEAVTCSYRCICSQPYKCCTSELGTTCKLAPGAPILCPQVAC